MEIPARVHVLLAGRARQALVIRRGPSRQTAVIGWNRANDAFTVGQWLQGKIYPYRSDIAPDGRHWIYFAMGARGQTWTAVAKTPYLKALDFYPKGDAWNGGGLFATPASYWLDEPGSAAHPHSRQTSGFSVLRQGAEHPPVQGECPAVYFRRLERDGWTMAGAAASGELAHTTRFLKPVNAHWQLCKQFHAGPDHPLGKGACYESHRLCAAHSGESIDFPHMEWADVDGDRLLWAERGKLMTGRVTKNGLEHSVELIDLNPLRFNELSAPY